MREHRIKFPELALLAVTRGMLGFGAGLLLSDRFSRKRRPVVGTVMFAIGALSTIPFAFRLLRKPHNHHPGERTVRSGANAPS